MMDIYFIKWIIVLILPLLTRKVNTTIKDFIFMKIYVEVYKSEDYSILFFKINDF